MNIMVQKQLLPLAAGQDNWLLHNPDRGFRAETVWYVKEMAAKPDTRAALEEKLDIYLNGCLPELIKLDMVYIYLTGYNEGDIPPEGIATIQTFFDICRERKLKIMARIAYCDSWQDLATGVSEEIMLRHIKQLSPLIKKNADVIHTLQGGFVGAYGEWAECYQEPPVDYRRVIMAIMEHLALPSNLYWQARLPEYKNLVRDIPEYYERIGYDQDAFFGEQQCYGWESGDFQIGHPNGQWEQLTAEAATTPQDGELFVNVNLVETRRMVRGMDAILELAHHRHTAFSCWHGYKEIPSDVEPTTVMGQWKTQPITEKMLKKHHIVYCPHWFIDKNGEEVERNVFQFVRDYLGYKLEAQEVVIKGEGKPDSEIAVKMSLKNYGFSAAFNLMSGFAVLNSDNKPISTVQVGEPSKWYSHSPTDHMDTEVPVYELEGKLKLPSEQGNYKIAFFLKNTLEDFARLGNQLPFENGYNVLCELNI